MAVSTASCWMIGCLAFVVTSCLLPRMLVSLLSRIVSEKEKKRIFDLYNNGEELFAEVIEEERRWA